jgi:rubredoxin/uncharacterized membrane protein
MKKWQCTVCGYIHEGEEPPEVCPVCGADKSKFIEVIETGEKPAEEEIKETESKDPSEQTSEPSADPYSQSSKPSKTSKTPTPGFVSFETVTNLMIKHHLHPITVHFPNGIIPMAVAFIFLAAIFRFVDLSQASFYSMIFVVLTLPVALFTGYNEWQKKYQGAMTRIFKIKIISAIVVTVVAVIVVLWHLIAPESFQNTSGGRTLFLLLHLILLAATGIAGFIGGKLVFKD